MKVVLGIKLYTLQEVGELLDVQTQTVSKYIQDSKLKSRVIGGRKYVTEENLREFLQSVG